jgi:predicted unusual protein kinase regulating ubiquinone biosynthesis (AarF/ABC1/UbiB family)
LSLKDLEVFLAGSLLGYHLIPTKRKEASMSAKDFRTSRWARLGKLGAATLGASAGYMGNRVGDLLRDPEGRVAAKNKRLGAAGKRLAETMGELKGAAMKLGQLLSKYNGT